MHVNLSNASTCQISPIFVSNYSHFPKSPFLVLDCDSPDLKYSPSIFWILTKLTFSKIFVMVFCEFGECLASIARMVKVISRTALTVKNKKFQFFCKISKIDHLSPDWIRAETERLINSNLLCFLSNTDQIFC